MPLILSGDDDRRFDHPDVAAHERHAERNIVIVGVGLRLAGRGSGSPDRVRGFRPYSSLPRFARSEASTTSK